MLASIAVTWLLPAPIYAYYSTFMDWTLVPVNNTGRYTWSIDHVSELRQLFLTTALLCSICVVLMLLLNAVMMGRLLARSKDPLSSSAANYTRANINLAFSGAIMFLIQFVYLVYLCSTVLGVRWSRYSQAANSFVGDLMSMSNPFVVLACSKAVQHYFVKSLPCCFANSVEGSSTTAVKRF